MNEQKRMFLAILLTGVILASWQYFYTPTVAPTKRTNSNALPQEGVALSQKLTEESRKTLAPSVEPSSQQAQAEQFEVSREGTRFVLDTFLRVNEVMNPTTLDSFQEITGVRSPLQFFQVKNDLAAPIVLKNLEVSDDRFSGSSSDGVRVAGRINQKGMLELSFQSDTPKQYILKWESEPKQLESNHHRVFSYLDTGLEQIELDDSEAERIKPQWSGIDFHYHLFAATVVQKDVAHRLRSEGNGVMTLKTEQGMKEFKTNLVFAKKDYNALKEMGGNLHRAVDFGWWGVVALPILWGLQTFYDWIPNYGIAIILLTLIIRLLLFPLNIKQTKSMKKMQEIQPQLTAIREKYKDDPMTTQKETMDLMKRKGANPMSGCLPLILQMPIFFAFYKVLFNSVELVNSPFIGWIQDLSEKDPYYVLPILMGISFFLQQRLMPNTITDPVQKKVMMFIPFVFLIAMINLPAGLNLYFLVSNLFGIAQTFLSKKFITA